ncbi:MAG: hydroxymethylbilane synthase [Acidimicrobiales bacterium]|nr:hydroxymethylbilane synthase [Hyphomonadaceae bacterium]RZV41265.1 MAG: hydroxymethylbilane synthase [Acidimicrobiales bacterium]
MSADQKALKIGTRGSPLALYQARLVQRLLGEAENIAVEDRDIVFPIIVLKTSGDRLTDRALIEAGGKGLFTKELEEALHDERIDLAVHSMKDVPTNGHADLDISTVLKRADVRDAFISLTAKTLNDLPIGATLGTASIRRQAQALRVRPDLKFTLLRGNVGTRLKKLARGECDATFLAAAGLQRLDQADKITDLIETTTMLPAPAQGAIGIEIRKPDAATRKRLDPLHHANTAIAIGAERAFLNALDGSCRTPIAALAEIDGDKLHFRGEVFTPGGDKNYARSARISLGDTPYQAAIATGIALGQEIRAEAGTTIDWVVE